MSAKTFGRAIVFSGANLPFLEKDFPLPDKLSSGQILVKHRLSTLCGPEHPLKALRYIDRYKEIFPFKSLVREIGPLSAKAVLEAGEALEEGNTPRSAIRINP